MGKESISIYTTKPYSALFDLRQLKSKIIALELKDMIRSFIEDGGENDFCIMPFIPKYDSLLATFRAKKRNGIILFISDTSVSSSITQHIHANGAILVDIRHERPAFIRFLVLFLIETFKNRKSYQGTESLSDDISIVKAVQNPYTQNIQNIKIKPIEIPKRVESVIEEAIDYPEIVPIKEYVDRKDFMDCMFTFNFDIFSQKHKKKLPLLGVGHLSRIKKVSQDNENFLLFFRDFKPSASFLFFRKSAELIGAKRLFQTVEEVLKSPDHPLRQDNEMQFTFEIDNINRNIPVLPALVDKNEIGFIVLAGAIVQKRRYFRISPSMKSPLTAIISSDDYQSRKVSLIDVSERGLSFWSATPLELNLNITVYLKWPRGEVVCAGMTRFLKKFEGKNQYKIGIELYQNEIDCNLLREYIFNCQLEMLNILREESDMEGRHDPV